MPDYHSYPLWDVDDPDNVDPATLPLSDALRARLEAWADAYDAILNPDDPAASGFAGEAAARAFDAEGVRLWHALAAELGPGYAVAYYSVVRRVVLPAQATPSREGGDPRA
jgi:hypothetical protein